MNRTYQNLMYLLIGAGLPWREADTIARELGLPS